LYHAAHRVDTIAAALARRSAAGQGDVVLSDRSIREAIAAGRLRLLPFDGAAVQPASVDLRLGSEFRVFRNWRYSFIDPREPQPDLTEVVEIGEEEPFILHPGEFVLARTEETVTLPDDIVARVEGKSSNGRLGLLVHATAGYVDPGFSGTLTLELSNVANLPIRLYRGMKIGQIAFEEMSTAVDRPYGSAGLGSKYQGQMQPTASRSFQEFGAPRGAGQ
jgi:dCTP deaminase